MTAIKVHATHICQKLFPLTTKLDAIATTLKGLKWWVCMNIINNYFFVFSISLLLYHTEATGFRHTIVWSAPPDIEKISHQQLT